MKLKGIDSNGLKMIACLSMLIDHITYAFIPEYSVDGWMGVNVAYLVGRGLGRSAFVIFAFLLVEGVYHTKDRKRYALTMLMAAVVSELPFDYLIGRLNSADFLVRQNVMFTFTLGIVSMILLEEIKDRYLYQDSKLAYNGLSVSVCMAAFTVAYFLRVDYGVVGIALIFIFYFLRGMKKRNIALMVFIWSIGCIFLEHMLEWAGLIALIPIFLYNGERGSKNLKWLFYVFYPLHMLVIGVIRWVI